MSGSIPARDKVRIAFVLSGGVEIRDGNGQVVDSGLPISAADDLVAFTTMGAHREPAGRGYTAQRVADRREQSHQNASR